MMLAIMCPRNYNNNSNDINTTSDSKCCIYTDFNSITRVSLPIEYNIAVEACNNNNIIIYNKCNHRDRN